MGMGGADMGMHYHHTASHCAALHCISHTAPPLQGCERFFLFFLFFSQIAFHTPHHSAARHICGVCGGVFHFLFILKVLGGKRKSFGVLFLGGSFGAGSG